jgi:hypothetical protein
VIGEHPSVHAIRHETRFLVDPGGLEDLACALTVGYRPYQADDALRRLAWLLQERLTGQTMEEFRGWALDQELGAERYQSAISRLWRELVWYDVQVDVPARRAAPAPLTATLSARSCYHAPGAPPHHRRVIGKYFRDRTESLPGVNCDRDRAPSDERRCFTYCSAMGTVDVTEVLNWLAPVYDQWLAARPELLRDQHYVEVRIEDLADRWPTSRTELFERLGLPDTCTTAVFSRDRVHRREVTDRLGRAIDRFGYTTPALLERHERPSVVRGNLASQRGPGASNAPGLPDRLATSA